VILAVGEAAHAAVMPLMNVPARIAGHGGGDDAVGRRLLTFWQSRAFGCAASYPTRADVLVGSPTPGGVSR
jgi:hypothetical protein